MGILRKYLQNLKNSDPTCFLSDAEKNFQKGVKNNTCGAKMHYIADQGFYNQIGSLP